MQLPTYEIHVIDRTTIESADLVRERTMQWAPKLEKKCANCRKTSRNTPPSILLPFTVRGEFVYHNLEEKDPISNQLSELKLTLGKFYYATTCTRIAETFLKINLLHSPGWFLEVIKLAQIRKERATLQKSRKHVTETEYRFYFSRFVKLKSNMS